MEFENHALIIDYLTRDGTFDRVAAESWLNRRNPLLRWRKPANVADLEKVLEAADRVLLPQGVREGESFFAAVETRGSE